MPPCVYTSLIGGYERLNEQSVAAASGVEFVCFTDDPSLRSETWTIRPIERRLPADPVRSSRWVKLHPHRLLPEHDVSLYIDNSVLLKADPTALIEALLPCDTDLALMRHSYRGHVLEESEAVKESQVDAWHIVDEQIEHYRITDPGVLAAQTLWSGILLRRHHADGVITAMETWWEQILRYSRRDQLSLQAALRSTSLIPLVHEHDLFDSEWWRWPVSDERVSRRPATLTDPERRVTELLEELTTWVGSAQARAAALDHLEGTIAAMQAQQSSLRWATRNLLSAARRRLRPPRAPLADPACPTPPTCDTSTRGESRRS